MAVWLIAGMMILSRRGELLRRLDFIFTNFKKFLFLLLTLQGSPDIIILAAKRWTLSSVGRASAWRAEGQRFETVSVHQLKSLESFRFKAFLRVVLCLDGNCVAKSACSFLFILVRVCHIMHTYFKNRGQKWVIGELRISCAVSCRFCAFHFIFPVL